MEIIKLFEKCIRYVKIFVKIIDEIVIRNKDEIFKNKMIMLIVSMFVCFGKLLEVYIFMLYKIYLWFGVIFCKVY